MHVLQIPVNLWVVVSDRPNVDLEVLVVDRIKPDQCRIRSDIDLRHLIFEDKGPAWAVNKPSNLSSVSNTFLHALS